MLVFPASAMRMLSDARVRSFSSLLDASDDIPVSAGSASRNRRKRGDCFIASIVLACLIVLGLCLGLILPTSNELHGPYRRISTIIGWTYFCSWSVSFYPQVLLNFQRQTSIGLSFDFLLYNVLAFSCYSAFTCSLFWSKSVQRAYNKRHGGQPNKVQLNDAVFALHAMFVSFLTLAQVMYYDWRGQKQRPSKSTVTICGVIVVGAALYALVVWVAQVAWDMTNKEGREGGAGGGGGGESEGYSVLNWLDFLYFLSYVKVVTGILKYVPQVLLNIRRRSTKGWTIWNVILDLTGGLLSVLQLVLDCWNAGDWGGIRGYPVKFAIGFVSVFFDLIFLLQHYILYPQRKAVVVGADLPLSDTPSAPLLGGRVLEGSGGAGRRTDWWIEGAGSAGGAGDGWWIEQGAGVGGTRYD